MPDWTRQARCRDEDPELFFPIGRFRRGREQFEKARRICLDCLVARECLELALVTGSEFGMWGAATPEERRADGAGQTLRAWTSEQRGDPR